MSSTVSYVQQFSSQSTQQASLRREPPHTRLEEAKIETSTMTSATTSVPTYLPPILKTFSVFALATGTAATFKGLNSVLSYFPSNPTPTTLIASPPSILGDSNFAYFGAMWASYGGILWWTSNDLEERKVPLAILGAFMVLGGVGRGFSAWRFGFSHGAAKVATVLEFVGPAVIWAVLR